MKEYIKTCKQYGTSLQGFKLRKGCVYGKNSGRLFVCVDATDKNGISVFISRDNGLNWKSEKVIPGNKIYDAIVTHVGNGASVKPTTYHNPMGKIPGKPVDRKVNNTYLRFADTAYQIRKQNMDNCDFGGGGDAVMNNAHKDSVIKPNMSLQYNHELERKVTIYDVKRIETTHSIIWVEQIERRSYIERTDKEGTTIK